MALFEDKDPLGLMLTNSTSIHHLHERELNSFMKLYKRKAYVYKYLN